MAQEPRSPRAEKTQTGPAVRRIPLPFTQRAFVVCLGSCTHLRSPTTSVSLTPLSALAFRRLAGRRLRHHPTPGAEAFVGLFDSDDHPPGIPIPSLPFLLCEAEHQTLT